MIGWSRCSNCHCLDEDACKFAPKNVGAKTKFSDDSLGCLHPCPKGEYWHGCKCYRQMGNDFWFLPSSSCLYR